MLGPSICIAMLIDTINYKLNWTQHRILGTGLLDATVQTAQVKVKSIGDKVEKKRNS